MSGSIPSRELQLEAVVRHDSIIISCGQSIESTSCKEGEQFFGLGTVWSKNSLKVLTKKENKVQMEKALVAFCIRKSCRIVLWT